MSSAQPIAIAITLAQSGGATAFVYRFARWMRNKGHNIVVLAGEEGNWLRDRCSESDIRFERVHHLRRNIHPIHDILAVPSFHAVLKQLNPSALHLNSSKAGVIGSLAGRWAGTPNIVYCIAGWAVLDAASPLQYAAYLLPEQLTAWAKDAIVCLHPGDKQFAETHSIRPKHGLHVIPNGIDREALETLFLSKEEARHELDIPIHKKIIGSIANFYPAKDLGTTLQAIARLVQQDDTIHFCLIGDGPERPSVERTIDQLDLRPHVTLTGAREHAARYLPAFDAFVLASKKEGMPFVMLEAAAARLPIVATDVGANAWMLPEALLVPPQNSERLADALRQALAQSATPSYETSLARFTEEACFTAHERLLLARR